MSIESLFEKIKNLKIAIVGDVMLDSYIYGNVSRLSPEAPVPIIEVYKKENRLGGAANVALNVQALGATPLLISVIGRDNEAKMVESLLTDMKIETMGMLNSEDRKTTVKTRIIGNKSQIARIDQEVKHSLSDKDNERLISTFSNIISHCDALILEDYDKGVLNPKSIEAIIEIANSQGKIIAVDPKYNNFHHYKGVTLFKPNLKELTLGLKENLDEDYSIESIFNLEEKLREKLGHTIGLITLSERGVLIKSATENHTAMAHQRNIADVSGAGDTVISVATCVLACGEKLSTVAELSNLAGGLVCEQPGVVPINKEDLIKEIKRTKVLD